MQEHKINSLKEARGIFSHPVLTESRGIELEEHQQALQGYSVMKIPIWQDQVPLKNALGEVMQN